MFSKCGKCGGSMFKLVTQEPSGSNYKINFVQCSSCAAPVGVMDYYNTGAQLEKQKKEIDNLKSSVANIEHMVRQIAHVLNQRR